MNISGFNSNQIGFSSKVKSMRTLKPRTALSAPKEAFYIEKTGQKYEVPVQNVYHDNGSAKKVMVDLSQKSREHFKKEQSDDAGFILGIFSKKRKTMITEDVKVDGKRIFGVENNFGYLDIEPEHLVIADNSKLN